MKRLLPTLLVFITRAAAAQDSLPPSVAEHYVRRDEMIPMRDGKRLFTTLYLPRDTTRSYPILLSRTPYGSDTYLHPTGPAEGFARAGYIFAFQDVRGRYQSEGTFVDVRPYIPSKHSPTEIDETTDTWDTVDWLVKHAPHNNGRVGQYGISYLGFYSTMGLIDAHPALKAVSPQAPVTDWFVGDDFHHNGAFFLADAFGFYYSFGVARPEPTRRREPGFVYPTPDSYQFFLDMGPLANAERKYYQGRAGFWGDLMSHGSYDQFWRSRTPLPHLKKVTPAVLTVGGWYDAEDLWGTLHVYQTVERNNPGIYNALVMGPWWHAGWFLSDGSRLGDVEFGAKTAEEYHERVELPFFEHFLRDAPGAPPPEATVFETGANRWRSFDQWPPKGVVPTPLYLGPSGRLERARPASAASDEYRSDPAHPVPYIDGVVTHRTEEYMTADQRFAAHRPDVLTYRTEPLDRDLTIAGPITASLFVATTGTDADWVVKLIDVYPDDTPDPDPNPGQVHLGGYQQLVRAEIMRGKFRSNPGRPEPFVPGRPTKVELILPDAFHTFRPGHRVMVQIQSSWFPLADRNPQRFMDIYRATEADFRPATHRVFRGGERASHLILPVLP
jgi:putative CocE/NonD family hydrolase